MVIPEEKLILSLESALTVSEPIVREVRSNEPKRNSQAVFLFRFCNLLLRY